MIFTTSIDATCTDNRETYYKYATSQLLTPGNQNEDLDLSSCSRNTDRLEYSFSVPIDETVEPVLLTGHANPLTNECLFMLVGSELLNNGWDYLDTGNWTSCVFEGPQSLRVRLRKLSAAQHGRAIEEFFYGEDFDLPIIQFQVADLSGAWPGDQGFAISRSAANEERIAQILGDLH
jgi:hypothetical protein